jgi:hypothetical protein
VFSLEAVMNFIRGKEYERGSTGVFSVHEEREMLLLLMS